MGRQPQDNKLNVNDGPWCLSEAYVQLGLALGDLPEFRSTHAQAHAEPITPVRLVLGGEIDALAVVLCLQSELELHRREHPIGCEPAQPLHERCDAAQGLRIRSRVG
eukprot:14940028-Alexandrium_andersonii.AAC.1